ncbi:MAG: molybdenum cofactor biosynthesis protein MoaE [Acidimicrobiales bacterium]|nr:molybdenum cofactor biosynthesis protein MoaE [Acidimicrobiales bacterium]
MTTPDTLAPPDAGDDWVGLSVAPLPVEVASRWAERDDCGGIVTFVGAARDHSEGRPGVHLLEYEAYERQVVPRLARVATEARERWSDIGRVALLHRVGPLAVRDAAVVVVVSAPHRDSAFDAARFCIDTLKSTVPIWKKESWEGGSSWGLEAQHLVEPESAPRGVG